MIQWKRGAGKKPITKNGNPQKANQNKGATPIEKNVIVVDDQGNEYEATYPKRAKGLVKNGRARFVDENKICLACPPENIMEDQKMKDTEIKVDETTGEVIEKNKDTSKYTLNYALEQLEKVRCESAKFAVETREKISEIKSGGPEDIGAAAAGDALRTLAQEQEQIFRRMIDFYIGMISDLKKDASQKNSERQQFLDFVTNCSEACDCAIDLADYEKIWKVINS